LIYNPSHEILAGVVLRSGVYMGISSIGLGRFETSIKISNSWER
jgi:hypothetical protein